ncbi:MAG: KEOPS complex subunit Cgi121 [Candidatus Micrarchaeia archaeon]
MFNLDFSSKITNKIIIKKCSSKLTIERLIANINNNNLNCVQVFNPEFVINRVHLIAAYINAVNAFEEKNNISQKLNLELLLYSAMTRQIEKAIKRIGANDNKNFILFSTVEDYEKIRVYIDKEEEFSKSIKEQLDTAKKYNIIADKKNLDYLIIQALAISIIKEG